MSSGLLIAVAALLLAIISGVRPLAVALVVVWALGFGAVPIAAQSWMAKTMPASVEGGLALFVSARCRVPWRPARRPAGSSTTARGPAAC